MEIILILMYLFTKLLECGTNNTHYSFSVYQEHKVHMYVVEAFLVKVQNPLI